MFRGHIRSLFEKIRRGEDHAWTFGNREHFTSGGTNGLSLSET